MRNRIVIFSWFILLSSCKRCKETTDDKLCTTTLQPAGIALRLDGYYYYIYNPPYRDILFLYENGVLLYGGAISEDQVAEFETKYANGDYYNNNKNNIMVWGNFRVSQNQFTFERWYPSTNNLIAYVREGEIVNDTTFKTTRVYRCDGSNESQENATYHFKEFSPKPDSISPYIP